MNRRLWNPSKLHTCNPISYLTESKLRFYYTDCHLMWFREIRADTAELYLMRNTSTVCGQNAQFSNIIARGTGLWSVNKSTATSYPHPFLTFETTWRRVVIFTLRPLALCGKYSLYEFDRRLIRSQRRYESYKWSLPTPGIKLSLFGCQTRGQVTIQNYPRQILVNFKVCHPRCVVKIMVDRMITVNNTTRSF
jgi:hypothetical protein